MTVSVRGLTARAGGTVLVDAVDLDVPTGGVTALLGPSGSGKTTTALALLGEAEPGVQLGGSVEVSGRTVVDEAGPTAEAARLRGGTVAYLPQHPGSALNPARRTGAVLGELAALHGEFAARSEARAAGAAALEQAQLPADRALLRRFPHQFSGGQRQRVALAQALACGPEVLVLDEPGTGLDTVTRAALVRELAQLATAGPAILLLSHDHALVRALADRAVRLERGRAVAAGSVAEVLGGGDVAYADEREGGDASVAERAEAEGGERRTGERPRPDGELATDVPMRPQYETPTAPPPRAPSADEPTSPPLLDVRGLRAWLRTGGRGRVLDDIGFALRPGECLGVAGRSGSGKTTLARCLAGLHERRDGAVELDGSALPVLRRRDRTQTRRVQYVWQEVRGSFDDRRPVLDQVARTAVRLRGLTEEAAVTEATALLARLDLPAATARRHPGALSGGELQRVAFARAALADPDVLLCDEITSALDDIVAALLLAEVARLRRAGTAVVWIGHDLALLRRLADRLLVLDAGAVAELDACARVLDAPRSAAARELRAAGRLGEAGDGGGAVRAAAGA